MFVGNVISGIKKYPLYRKCPDGRGWPDSHRARQRSRLKVVDRIRSPTYIFLVRLVIVEDQLMFREVVRKACERDLGHTVVGECGTGAEAPELVKSLRPDVLLLDLSLPDVDGFEVAEKVLSQTPDMKILVLSSLCDDFTMFRIEQSGVHGFVDKNSNTTLVLGDALKAVEGGRSYYSAIFQKMKQARISNPVAFTKTLTEWERRILALIGLGLSDEEIGEKLGISHHTVQTHRSNILRKLKLPGTPKLIRFAIDNGFTQLPWKAERHPSGSAAPSKLRKSP